MKLRLITLVTFILTVCSALTSNAAPPQSQAPAAARTIKGTVPINGAQIYYTITGQGVPLVLIHGYPLNGDLFAKERQSLSRQFQVITLNLRGFGRSISPDEFGSVDLYATDVLGLLDFLHIDSAIIGGHSLGGAITLRMYQLAPQRFRGMILFDPAAFPPPIVEQFLWSGYQEQAKQLGAPSLLPLLLPEFLTGEHRLNDPDLVATFTNLILAASLKGLVGGALALENRPDFTTLFPTINVPTLVSYGIEDTLTPIEQGQMLDQLIPNSE